MENNIVFREKLIGKNNCQYQKYEENGRKKE